MSHGNHKKIAVEFKAGRKLPKFLETDSPIYKFPECVGKILPDPIYYYTSDEGSGKVSNVLVYFRCHGIRSDWKYYINAYTIFYIQSAN